MNLVEKYFSQNAKIRILILKNNEWFVAKDIAQLLGYKDTKKAVDDHTKKAVFIDSLNMGDISPTIRGTVLHPQTKLILEADVWRLIIKSHLPEAEKIETWLMEEVLPSIRKTGSYSISQQPQIQNSTEQIIELDKYFVATANLIDNLEKLKATTLYRLDKYILENKNFSPLETFKIDLENQFFLPTELGRMINKSPIEVNLMLAHKGFQIRENGVWKMTSSGSDFGISIIGKYNQIKWKIKTIV